MELNFNNQINSIYIQSFHKEIINNTLIFFLNQLYEKLNNYEINIVLFLDKISKNYIEEINIPNFYNLEIVYVENKFKNHISYIFYYLINYRILQYPIILLLEVDCILIKDFIPILNNNIRNKNFWIYGSSYYGIKNVKFHINGVAVYNRNKSFINNVKNIFIKQDNINKNINYDFILSRSIHRHNKKNLIDSEYIINISSIKDINLDYKQIKPNAVVIHQKYDKTIKFNRLTYKKNKNKIRLAHVINIFNCKKDNPSFLYHAQPITFKSMRESQLHGERNGININLYTINYPEDDIIIPHFFKKLPHLQNSTMKQFPKISGSKKLPIIQEIFDSILENTDEDYLIFTNSDIGVQLNFYQEIIEMIHKETLKSFIINRRTIPKYKKGEILTINDLNYIYKKKGEPHPGYDCFVIHRSILKNINMGLMFTGYPPWGSTLKRILNKIDNNCILFKNKYLTFHLGDDKSWINSDNLLGRKNKKLSHKILKNL